MGGAEPKDESFEGHRGLVLDDAVTEVHDYIVVVMQHWLARGIDGWRLDAAYAVPAGVLRYQGRAWQRLHASSPPAGTAVLEGPSHGWEVAF
jgi:glycosidase